MEEYIKALSGVTYQDWIKIRSAIDRSFDRQKKELEKEPQLKANGREILNIIHSQFG